MKNREFVPIELQNVYEKVYAYDVKSKPGLQVRVYSSIGAKGHARKVGADAIRVIIFSVEHSRTVGSESRVYRTKGWKENLRNRLRTTMEQIASGMIKCGCGAWMVERTGKYGTFLGCVRYPECKNTQKLKAA
ncbi:MAG: topoisomerase DNA-binding C4 zinc finger domain-containing protein [bacterium]